MLDKKYLAVLRVIVRTIRQFTGQTGTGKHRLPLHKFTGFTGRMTSLCGKDYLVHDSTGIFRMFLQIIC